MRRVLILNGPNLDLLGVREPEIYGRTSLAALVDTVWAWGRELGFDVEHFQSNHEGELVERVHDAARRFDGIVVNAGALTHYSFSLHDALAAVEVPAVEVHISNIRAREPWRRRSVISSACVASIYGRGIPGYRWALLHLRNRDAATVETLRYGENPDQKMDVRRPATPGSTAPLAVIVHGGLWLREWASDTTETWAVELTRRGWITANVEYRRLGTGGGWPESFTDVAAAFKAAASLPGVDLAQLHAIGHSAGATMALWSAGQATSLRPTMVTSVAGITDLVRARTEGLGDHSIARIEGRRHPRPEESSPRHRLPTGVEVTLVSCLEDSLVDPSYATDYAAAARQAGDQVKLIELETTHSAVLDPLEPGLEAVIAGLAGSEHP
jgi:3-dehydroquinate dehydratase-2